MLEYAKPIEELKAAPRDVRNAMCDYANFRDYAAQLRTDIAEHFDYPSLWAAIDRLVEFTTKHAVANYIYRNAGYTSDDAFKYWQHERDGGDEQ